MYRGRHVAGFDAGGECNRVDSVCELDTGVVLTHFTYQRKNHYIISKSGGFGEADLLCRLAKLTGAGTMQKEDISCLRNTI